jgi:hypothetical protein
MPPVLSIMFFAIRVSGNSKMVNKNWVGICNQEPVSGCLTSCCPLLVACNPDSFFGRRYMVECSGILLWLLYTYVQVLVYSHEALSAALFFHKPMFAYSCLVFFL